MTEVETSGSKKAPKAERTHFQKLLRKWSIRLALLLVGFIVFCGIGLEVTGSPDFCASCHNMKPYVESWRQSTHNQVNCATCHYEPGFIPYLKGKITDGQAHLVIFMTGKNRGKYHAEISDKSCLRCHAKETLQSPKEFKGISFSHTNHVDQMRRKKQLRCVTCHGQLVQGEHLTVDERECFICHFKADDQGKRDPVLSDCRTCHREVPVDVVKDDHVFHHQRYIDSGVDCRSCHVDIIVGNGAVNYDHCMECHSEKEKVLKEIIATKYTTESYHLNHVTNHKVECWRCHDVIKHEKRINPTAENFQASCTTCHSDRQHLGPREMYKGTGGIGVPDSPAKMYLSNVDCASCHAKRVKGQFGNHATDVSYLKMGDACNSCHGPGYDSMLHNWQKLLFEAETQAGQRLLNVEQELFKQQKSSEQTQSYRDAAKLSEDARHNLEFVKAGKGHHNIEYAMKLLNVSMRMSEEAMGLVSVGYKGDPVPEFQMTCTLLCHSEMETRKVPLGSVNYPHKTHIVDMGFACTECHGDMQHHGQNRFVNCKDCHHGEGQGKVTCADCHQDVAAMTQGKGAASATGTPDTMTSAISCTDCHTQVAAGQATTVDGVRQACVGCHDAKLAAKLDEWLVWGAKTHDPLKQKLDELKKSVEAKRVGNANVIKLENRVRSAEQDLALLANGKTAHNPAYAEAMRKEVEGLLADIQTLLQSPE